MYTVIFHPEADAEFLQSIDWYNEQKESLGNRFFLSVNTTLNIIEARPVKFVFARKPFREASVKFFPFTIIYKLNKPAKLVFISAVYHTSRNPRKKFRRQPPCADG